MVGVGAVLAESCAITPGPSTKVTVSLTWPGKPNPASVSTARGHLESPVQPSPGKGGWRVEGIHLPPHLLLSRHLGVSSKSWVKWGSLATGTAKFEKPNLDMQLRVGK